jgi:alpha-mannosidase
MKAVRIGIVGCGNISKIYLEQCRQFAILEVAGCAGRHEFAYAIYPHTGDWRDGGVVREGFCFNAPLHAVAVNRQPETRSYFSVDDANIVIDTVKYAEDSDAVVVRLYEAHGGRGRARLKVGFPFASASLCNVLEDEIASARVLDGAVEFDYKPNQIITVKLS